MSILSKSKYNSSFASERWGVEKAPHFICENFACDNKWDIYKIEWNKRIWYCVLCNDCINHYNSLYEKLWPSWTYSKLLDYIQDTINNRYWKLSERILRWLWDLEQALSWRSPQWANNTWLPTETSQSRVVEFYNSTLQEQTSQPIATTNSQANVPSWYFSEFMERQTYNRQESINEFRTLSWVELQAVFIDEAVDYVTATSR